MDPYPGGPKPRGSGFGSGSATLQNIQQYTVRDFGFSLCKYKELNMDVVASCKVRELNMDVVASCNLKELNIDVVASCKFKKLDIDVVVVRRRECSG
jgi:hypothetical protein